MLSKQSGLVMGNLNASDSQIRLLMGDNVLRVWNENEKVAKSLQIAGTQLVNENWQKRDWSFFDYARSFRELYPGAYEEKTNTYKDPSLDLTKEK